MQFSVNTPSSMTLIVITDIINFVETLGSPRAKPTRISQFISFQMIINHSYNFIYIQPRYVSLKRYLLETFTSQLFSFF
jgi:hypothetical protein